jgi:hypothetical protein
MSEVEWESLRAGASSPGAFASSRSKLSDCSDGGCPSLGKGRKAIAKNGLQRSLLFNKDSKKFHKKFLKQYLMKYFLFYSTFFQML